MKPVTTLALTAAVLMGAGQVVFTPTPALAGPGVHINCPLSQVRKEITTPLPGGWWNTPYVNNLVSTEVTNIGGKPTLMCRYGPAGDIMHLAPTGMLCAAVAGGFNCMSPLPPPPPPIPGIHSSGTVNIPQTYIVDLDTGALNAAGPGDLWFEAQTATQFYLTPRNGAQMSVGGSTPRGYLGCAAASYSSGRVNAFATVGRYVCVKTNAGRIAEVRINAIMGGGIKTMVMGYRTWN